MKALTIYYQEQTSLRFLSLDKSENSDEQLDLSDVVKFLLLPVPLSPSLGSPDALFTKANMAEVLHYLLDDRSSEDLTYPSDALFVEDGMALLHTLSNRTPMYGEICLQILDQMVVFTTDCCQKDKIKGQERLK